MASEREQLAALDKHQRRYLSRRLCAWCELPLDRAGCGNRFGDECPEVTRVRRRARCLSEYKPRPSRRKP